MSNCSNNSVNKYIIVEPAGDGVYSGLTICGGSGLVTDLISGCTDYVNFNGNQFNNDGTVIFSNDINAPTINGGVFYGDGSNLTGVSSIDSFATSGTYNNNQITFFGSNNFQNFNVDLSSITNNQISGATNVGVGEGVFGGVNNNNLEFRKLSGNLLNNNKITTELSGDTVVLDLDEPNMTLWPLVVKGNTLISGGATFLEGLTFNISELEYIIGQTIYYAGSSSVTLISGDTINDRIDVLVADISGNTSVVQGEPSENPVKPQINTDEQVEITFVTVGAGETTPEVTQTKIFDEGLGISGGEWDITTSSTTISGSSTNQSFSGSKSMEFTDSESGDYLVLDYGGDYDVSDDNILTFYVKNKIKWPNRYYIDLSFLDSSDNLNGNTVRLDNNRYGFSHFNTTSWQVVSIPLGDFGMNTNLLSKIKLEVKTSNNTTTKLNLFIDLMRFQAGAPTTSPQSIWLSFIGDDNRLATATNNTEQLRLSGGTNITTSIPNNNTAVFDLDDDINLNSVTANVYYGDGSNLTGIDDNYVVGGIYDPTNGVVTYSNTSGGTFQVSGFTTGMTDSYTDNSYLDGNVIRFDNNIQGDDLYNVDLTPILSGFSTTNNFVSGGTLNGSNLTLNRVGLSDIVIDVSELTDNTFVTGFVYSNNRITIEQNGVSDLSVDISSVTGLTSSGPISATTYYGDGSNLTGISTDDNYTSGSTLNGNVIEFTTTPNISGYSVDLSPIVDGKLNVTNFDTHTGDTSIHYTKDSINLSDLGSTGHTHNIPEVNGLQTDLDSRLTINNFNTYSGGVQTILDTKIEGGVNIGDSNEIFNGVNGENLEFRTISGGTNTTITTVGDVLKVDVSIPSDSNTFVDGFTYSDNELTISNNDGSSFDVTINEMTGLTVNGVLSASSYDNLPIDPNFYVTGGTFSSETLTLSRNDGDNITIYGFTPVPTDNSELTNGAGYITSFTNTQRTDEEIRDVASSQWVDGLNTTVIKDDVSNTIKIDSTDTNTQRSDSEIQTIITNNTEGFIKDYTVIESDVTQYQSSLQITQSQITDLTIFSGDYNDLSNKPTIPTDNSELSNGAGYITTFTDTFVDGANLSNNILTLTNNSGGDVIKIEGGNNVTILETSTNEFIINSPSGGGGTGGTDKVFSWFMNVT